jgi:hypothetical protein
MEPSPWVNRRRTGSKGIRNVWSAVYAVNKPLVHCPLCVPFPFICVRLLHPPKCHIHHLVPFTDILTVEVTPDGTLKPRSTLTQHLRQVLQVISSRNSKLAHKVLRCTLKITIIISTGFLLRTSKVCVGRNGGCSFESLQSLLSFGL